MLIDNTPPGITSLDDRVEGGVVYITVVVQDDLSPIQKISYSVDSAEPWNAVVPDDLIYDSTRETSGIKIVGLEHGPHVVAVRVTDSRGNARYKAVLLDVQ